MWPTLFTLLGLAMLVHLWVSATRARETAQTVAARLCAEARVQLLDQTVALREIRPVRVAGGFTWRRRYSFDYSVDGISRERGFLTYLGGTLESASLPVRPSAT